MEKNYVINVKTKAGTIFTVRGDTAQELQQNITDALLIPISSNIAALEEELLGVQSSPAQLDPVQTVVAAVGGTVISTPDAGFAPVAPPVSQPLAGAGTATRACVHGTMTKREGQGQWGPYKAFYCPTPKGAPDQCKAVYIKPNDPDWNNF